MASLGCPYVLRAHGRFKPFIFWGCCESQCWGEIELHEMDRSCLSDYAAFDLVRIHLATRQTTEASSVSPWDAETQLIECGPSDLSSFFLKVTFSPSFIEVWCLSGAVWHRNVCVPPKPLFRDIWKICSWVGVLRTGWVWGWLRRGRWGGWVRWRSLRQSWPRHRKHFRPSLAVSAQALEKHWLYAWVLTWPAEPLWGGSGWAVGTWHLGSLSCSLQNKAGARLACHISKAMSNVRCVCTEGADMERRGLLQLTEELVGFATSIWEGTQERGQWVGNLKATWQADVHSNRGWAGRRTGQLFWSSLYPGDLD